MGSFFARPMFPIGRTLADGEYKGYNLEAFASMPFLVEMTKKGIRPSTCAFDEDMLSRAGKITQLLCLNDDTNPELWSELSVEDTLRWKDDDLFARDAGGTVLATHTVIRDGTTAYLAYIIMPHSRVEKWLAERPWTTIRLLLLGRVWPGSAFYNMPPELLRVIAYFSTSLALPPRVCDHLDTRHTRWSRLTAIASVVHHHL